MEGEAGSRSVHRHRVRPLLLFFRRLANRLISLFRSSVKLKSKTGSDRSIAHFYRHVDVFPYYNPAIILAPALKPLQAEAAKSLFMGGSGKVSLKASMHRETWVAGQRCYVDVRVENESGKRVRLSHFSPHFVRN